MVLETDRPRHSRDEAAVLDIEHPSDGVLPATGIDDTLQFYQSDEHKTSNTVVFGLMSATAGSLSSSFVCCCDWLRASPSNRSDGTTTTNSICTERFVGKQHLPQGKESGGAPV
jgi:hypothetical protein